MREFWRACPEAVNFVFLGEAGCGKSEIALNAAHALLERGDKPVHFFDMDMTKPLFRSRDVCQELEGAGVIVHYEEQFMDAPTLASGVQRLLRDRDCYVVMDVGGDYIGARSIGGFAPLLNREESAVYYVVNSYRPWSMDLAHIDGVLSQTLGVSHIELKRLRFIGNPNLGLHTRQSDVTDGIAQLREVLGGCVSIDFFCVGEDLCEGLPEKDEIQSIQIYLTYPWERGLYLDNEETKREKE